MRAILASTRLRPVPARSLRHQKGTGYEYALRAPCDVLLGQEPEDAADDHPTGHLPQDRRIRDAAQAQAHRLPHPLRPHRGDRKSTRLNSSHVAISYAVFCLKKTTDKIITTTYSRENDTKARAT